MSLLAPCQELSPHDPETFPREFDVVIDGIRPDRGGFAADRIPTWEEVARDHGQFLYNVAYRLAGNEDDARDLVQDALLRIRAALRRYEPRSLEGWLARIVTNLFLDEKRRRNRRPERALPDEPDRVLPCSPAADEVCTGISDEVRFALQQLPEEFRVPIVLCDMNDLSYSQIALATAVPIGTVRSRIHHGRRMLRATLTAYPRSE